MNSNDNQSNQETEQPKRRRYSGIFDDVNANGGDDVSLESALEASQAMLEPSQPTHVTVIVDGDEYDFEITPEPIETVETTETVWTPATHSNIKKGVIIRTRNHTRHDYQVHGSYATLVTPRGIEVKGGRIATVHGVYVNRMEDEHGNPVNEYAIETTVGMFSLDELEVCTQITVTELATLFVAANPDSKIQTVRAYIKAEIARGNLPATMIGNQYVINTTDANAWLANPKRGSRSATE
jgi:hypothetical protein